MHLFCFAFSEVFRLCEAENINFVEYFVIDKHFFEQIFRKVEPEIFLSEFLNSGDPLYQFYVRFITKKNKGRPCLDSILSKISRGNVCKKKMPGS